MFATIFIVAKWDCLGELYAHPADLQFEQVLCQPQVSPRPHSTLRPHAAWEKKVSGQWSHDRQESLLASEVVFA